MPIKVGILTVSDRCSRGEAEDTSGEALSASIGTLLPSSWVLAERACVPDEEDHIYGKLVSWSDQKGVNLILTTGGTGFAKRDVTPEATERVIEKRAPGLTQLMMAKSLEVTPTAVLSRAAAGIRGKTLIVNLPGSKKASTECLSFIAKALPHAVELLTDQVLLRTIT